MKPPKRRSRNHGMHWWGLLSLIALSCAASLSGISCSGAACSKAADCTDGKICLKGRCEPCAMTSECPMGTVCKAGKCVDDKSGNEQCASDNQCPPGKSCVGGKCRSSCACPKGQYCDTKGECQDGCLTTSDCRSAHICSKGKCVPRENAPAEQGTEPTQDSGVEQPADEFEPAGGDEATVEEPGGPDLPPFEPPPDFKPECQDDTDCTNLKGQDGWQCRSGKCFAVYCPAVPCKTGKCVGGKCVECAKDSDCGSAQKCYKNRCKAGDYCEQNSDCPGGRECQGKKCVGTPGSECTTSLPCLSPNICVREAGKQVGKCRAPCDIYNPSCKSGTLCAPLTKGGACLPPNNGRKVDESCDSSNRCEVNLVCINFNSTTSACTPICDTKKKVCGMDRECFSLKNQPYGACIKVGKEGETCGSSTGKVCKQSMVCVISSKGATSGNCREKCTPVTGTCPSGRVCSLLNKTSGACMPSTGGGKSGATCNQTRKCEANLFCVGPSGKDGMCRELCDLSAPGRVCKLPTGSNGYCKDFTQLGTKYGICLP